MSPSGFLQSHIHFCDIFAGYRPNPELLRSDGSDYVTEGVEIQSLLSNLGLNAKVEARDVHI